MFEYCYLEVRNDKKATGNCNNVFNQCHGEIRQVRLGHQGVADVVTAKRPDQCTRDTDSRSHDQTSSCAESKRGTAECAHNNSANQARRRGSRLSLRQLIGDQLKERQQRKNDQGRSVTQKRRAYFLRDAASPDARPNTRPQAG